MVKKVELVWGLVLTLLLAQPRPVGAQAQIRVSAGPTFATIEGDDAERPLGEAFGDAVDLGTETGFFAGASLSVPLGGVLSISPGVYFVQKGTSYERDLEIGSVEISYLQVPVTLGVEVTGADDPVGVRLFAGPEIAFEIDCELLETRGGFSILLPHGQFDDCHPPSGVEESERTSTVFGLVFGASVSLRNFFVNGGLDVGLSSLDDSGADEEFRNSAWFLGAGIVIGG